MTLLQRATGPVAKRYPAIRKAGLNFAAISYDSEEILKFFADRHKIDYPLLADPGSEVIRAYGVFNDEATGMQKGFARPAYFLSTRTASFARSFSRPLLLGRSSAGRPRSGNLDLHCAGLTLSQSFESSAVQGSDRAQIKERAFTNGQFSLVIPMYQYCCPEVFHFGLFRIKSMIRLTAVLVWWYSVYTYFASGGGLDAV